MGFTRDLRVQIRPLVLTEGLLLTVRKRWRAPVLTELPPKEGDTLPDGSVPALPVGALVPGFGTSIKNLIINILHNSRQPELPFQEGFGLASFCKSLRMSRLQQRVSPRIKADDPRRRKGTPSRMAPFRNARRGRRAFLHSVPPIVWHVRFAYAPAVGPSL